MVFEQERTDVLTSVQREVTTIPQLTVVKYSEPGHFCGSHQCLWFQHHHAGNYCVTSVGEYRPTGWEKDRYKYKTIYDAHGNYRLGARGAYETAIFKLKEGSCVYGEIECNCAHGDGETLLMRHYETREEAEREHMDFVERLAQGDNEFVQEDDS